ncbi:hypothetical protein DLH72_00465 [Candidatus Gracilibacteria bacterium]|nr:MAG: hypothetical protein DLH72_00465 [Candidatus Gracilibacteria bacterium]
MKLYLTPKKTELFIKSSVWNSIVEVFLDKKQIDVSNFLISVKISGKKIFIKTNKPIFNSEAILLEQEIISLLKTKIEKINLEDFDFKLKYL